MHDSHVGAVSTRLRRTLELAYSVEGVVAARAWETPGRMALAVRPGFGVSMTEVLKRVEIAVGGVREPGETWDFGILDELE